MEKNVHEIRFYPQQMLLPGSVLRFVLDMITSWTGPSNIQGVEAGQGSITLDS